MELCAMNILITLMLREGWGPSFLGVYVSISAILWGVHIIFRFFRGVSSRVLRGVKINFRNIGKARGIWQISSKRAYFRGVKVNFFKKWPFSGGVMANFFKKVAISGGSGSL
jgi:hypothetical protein